MSICQTEKLCSNTNQDALRGGAAHCKIVPRHISGVFISAFRVHVSPFTKDILDELGGYQLDYRGEVELKVDRGIF